MGSGEAAIIHENLAEIRKSRPLLEPALRCSIECNGLYAVRIVSAPASALLAVIAACAAASLAIGTR